MYARCYMCRSYFIVQLGNGCDLGNYKMMYARCYMCRGYVISQLHNGCDLDDYKMIYARYICISVTSSPKYVMVVI